MSDAIVRFNSTFEGLAHSVRRLAGESAQFSMVSVEQESWRCVIFAEGEMSDMYVGTGKTATEALNRAMDIIRVEKAEDE